MEKTILETEAAAQRAAAERALARYPVLKQDEIAALVRYISKDATALDRAAIASNADVHDQYRQLCRDHHLDRLRPLEIALVVAGIMAVVVIVAVIYTLKTA